MTGSLFCPYCQAQDLDQPVLSPLVAEYQSNLEPELTVEATPAAHYLYKCTRCGYEESHEKMA